MTDTIASKNGVALLHRGDCMSWLPTLRAESATLLLTDVPYDEVNRKSGGLRTLDKQDADEGTFTLDSFVDECVRVVSGSFYVFCGYRQASVIVQAFDRHGLTVRVGVWQKSNPSPMNGTKLWLSGVELCVFARKAKATFNEHCESPVWKYPSGRSKAHPTEKPLSLFSRLVEASTNPGDTVLDPCMGSGTAAVAALRLGRNFLGAEISHDYYALTRERLEMDRRGADHEGPRIQQRTNA